MQSCGFFSRLLGPLLKTSIPLKENLLKLLAKSVLIRLRSTTAASAADAGIHKNVLVSVITTLEISNKELEGIMKIVKSFEDSGLLIKGATQTIENETKE